VLQNNSVQLFKNWRETYRNGWSKIISCKMNGYQSTSAPQTNLRKSKFVKYGSAGRLDGWLGGWLNSCYRDTIQGLKFEEGKKHKSNIMNCKLKILQRKTIVHCPELCKQFLRTFLYHRVARANYSIKLLQFRFLHYWSMLFLMGAVNRALFC
jgi:hypothetical protein